MKTKNLPAIIVILGVIGITLVSFLPKGEYKMVIIKKDNFSIKALVADTPAKRALGLGGRANLGENEGMIFYFNSNGYPSIWMKGMKFPIDIIWLKDGMIVDIADKVPPPASPTSNLPSYGPKSEANQVLEVSSGFCEKNNLKIGDKLQIPKV